MRITRRLSILLLGIWFLLYGLIGLFGLSFNGLGVIMALLALAVGILLLIDR